MKTITRRLLLAAALALGATPVAAQGVAGETEVKIGNIMPYSGPASAYGIVGKTIVAYFNKVNEEGGIAGRQINIISLDDGYSPPKAVEAARQLVEREGVLAVFHPLGTASNIAMRGYLNAKKVPHLFTSTGATTLSATPDKFPFTVGWTPTYSAEGMIYARHILDNVENPKIAILYQNDDLGKDYLAGIEQVLGDRASELIVAKQSYETTDPTVNTQVISLHASGANVFVNVTTPKFGAQAIRKVAELGWKPAHYISFVSSSVGSVLTPAGLENSEGLITVQFIKDATDPQWAEDEGFKQWRAFMDKYMPDTSQVDNNVVIGYSAAETLKHVLKDVGKDLNRDTLMKSATSIKDLQLSMFLPEITLNTAPDDYSPVDCLKLARFTNGSWLPEKDLICSGK